MSDESRERAAKIDRRYLAGELVRIAGGRNQAEAELIQNILLEEGIPSMLRRSAGFDVPDFLAAGPRDVMVPSSAARDAREVLQLAGLAAAGTAQVVNPTKLLLGVLAAVAVAALVVLIGSGFAVG